MQALLQWLKAERATVATFAVVLAVYLVPLGSSPAFWNPNEMSHVALTVSLVEYGTIQVDRVLDDYGRVPQDLSVREGHAYSDKAPGLSFLGAGALVLVDRWLPRYGVSSSPDYWPLRNFLVALLVSFPAALLAVGLARHVARTRGMEAREGLALAFLFALATPWLTYASLLFSHVMSGATVALALMMARGLAELEESRVERRAAVIGLLSSIAVVTEYPTALLAAIVALTVWWGPRRRRAMPGFVMGAAAGALPLLIYNKAAWGSFFTTGYAFKASAEHAAVHAQGFFGVSVPTLSGLWGVLLSAQRGLLFYCPMLVCVLVGLMRSRAEHKVETRLTVAAIVLYVAFASGFVDWQGGWSAAPRHLVPLLPLLLAPFAVGLRVMVERRWSATLVAVLIGMSVSAAALSVSVTPYFPETFANPLGEIAARSVRDGYAMHNLLSDLFGVSPRLVLVGYVLATTSVVTAAAVGLVPRALRRTFALALLATAIALPFVVERLSPRESVAGREARLGLLGRLGY